MASLINEIKTEYNTGTFMNEDYSAIDEDLTNYTDFSNGQRMRISIFLAPKYLKYSDRIKKENCIFLHYNKNVEKLALKDELSSIGMTGFLVLKNGGGAYDNILEINNLYYLVVQITILQEDDVRSLRLEPYIFEITAVRDITEGQSTDRKIKIEFRDIITSLASRHSIASVIKNYPQITTSSSYKEAFCTILTYLKQLLKLNTNCKADFYKEVQFSYDAGGYDTLVASSFKKIDPEATILDALKILYQDCATPTSYQKDFKDNYVIPTNMGIPFFFREEYPDAQNTYLSLFSYEEEDEGSADSGSDSTNTNSGSDSSSNNSTKKDDKKTNSNTKIQQVSSTGGKTGDMMVYRAFTMRDMQMPFLLAFASDSKRIVYEIINPIVDQYGNLTESDSKFDSMNGYKKDDPYEFSFTPINQIYASNRWKNMIFLSTGASDNASALIYFKWIFSYYCHNFLNATNLSDGYVLNTASDFFVAQENMELNSDYKTPYEEGNANVYILTSEDAINECMCLIGKTIQSFVFLNDQYSFTLKGNIFRRPNEIIKFNVNKTQIESNQMVNFRTDATYSDYILLYVSRVDHYFCGNTYENRITTKRIYDRA